MPILRILAEGQASVLDYAPFLALDVNPMASRRPALTRAELTRALLNFAALSKALPDLLRTAGGQCEGQAFAPLRAELALNLSEEEGEIEPLPGLDGQAHYAVLRSELIALLGVDPDLQPVPPAAARLVETLLKVVRRDGATIYGGLVALEVTAIPEIQVFRDAVERFATQNGIELRPSLLAFFDAHIGQFEVEHAARLLAMHDRLGGSSELTDQGFIQVIAAMREWWSAMLGD